MSPVMARETEGVRAGGVCEVGPEARETWERCADSVWPGGV